MRFSNRWIWMFIFFVAGVHCAPAPLKESDSVGLPQVVFVPGYYGSTLIRERDARTIWFTAAQALFGDQTLALDDGGIRIPGAAPMRVGEVFRSLGVLKEVYGPVLDGLQARLSGRADVVPFAYDWRQDITHSAARLGQRVDALNAKGAPKVAVVAHSMGGLVTAHYLLYGGQPQENARLNLAGADRLHAVAMAAAPFAGTLAVFRNMQHGIRFGLNARALEGLAVASFPSSYQILPQYPNALVARGGADLSDWIFDAARWQEREWSLLKNADALDPKTRENRERTTRALLDAARAFNESMRPAASDRESDLPFLYYYSDSVPTVERAQWHEKQRALLFPGRDAKQLQDPASYYSPGDGTVTRASAQPPERLAALFPALVIEKKPQEHLEMLHDADNLNAIVEFLEDALELPDA